MKLSWLRRAAISASLFSLFLVTACRSDHVKITIQNQTGAAVRLLEVDYPNASFGAGSLGSGATFHYIIQTQGSGPVTVTYTDSKNAQPHITGPTLDERVDGSLEITLLPGGKAEFHPQFTQAR